MFLLFHKPLANHTLFYVPVCFAVFLWLLHLDTNRFCSRKTIKAGGKVGSTHKNPAPQGAFNATKLKNT